MKITKKYLKKIIESALDEQFRTSIDTTDVSDLNSKQVKVIMRPEYQKFAEDILNIMGKMHSEPAKGQDRYYRKFISYKGRDERLFAMTDDVIIDVETHDYLQSLIRSSTDPFIIVNAEEQLSFLKRKSLNLIYVGGTRGKNLITDFGDLEEVLLGLQEKEVDFMAAQADKESIKENKTQKYLKNLIEKVLFEQKIPDEKKDKTDCEIHYSLGMSHEDYCADGPGEKATEEDVANWESHCGYSKKSSALNPHIEEIVLKEIENLLNGINEEFTSSDEHFRSAEDTSYADPRSKNQGRALTRDKLGDEISLDDAFSSSEDKEQFFLEKIKDIYDHLETIAAAM
jgi:hypothetical protein